MSDRCKHTVSIAYPCHLGEGHEGVCQADPEGQLRIYGLTVESVREIAQTLADARRFGLIRGDDTPTIFNRYVTLRAALDRIIPRAGPQGMLRAGDVWSAIDEAEAK